MGLGQFVGGGGRALKFRGVVKKRKTLDFRSSEVGISAFVLHFLRPFKASQSYTGRKQVIDLTPWNRTRNSFRTLKAAPTSRLC